MYYKRKQYGMDKSMRPRIFVSSTFYDLKYIREDLSNFIKAHDFEPIMFEDGDIGYTPGKTLDDSCYEAMKSADMVLLIIGGNYGSPASGESKDEFKEYMSVTRNEFKEAINNGIPLFTFVDSKVNAEYGIYEANYKKIEVDRDFINFRNVKDINVFRFIREIRSIGSISIIEFEKIIQIKDFLSKQWSDMFKSYLNMLKTKAPNQRLESTVEEMRSLIQKMDIMIENVGENILKRDDPEKYQHVLQKQETVFLCRIISQGFGFYNIDNLSQEGKIQFLTHFLEVLNQSLECGIWKKIKSDEVEDVREFFNYFSDSNVELYEANPDFDDSVKDKLSILGDEKNRALLVAELAGDSYYKEMIRNDERK